MNKPLPPMLPGLPLLGNLFEFQKNRSAILRRGYETLGPVFSIRIGPKPFVVLIGPEHNEFFFRETYKKLNTSRVYQFMPSLYDKEPVGFAAEQEAYWAQRHILLAPFQGKKMAGYVEVMVQETETWLDGLGEEGTFELVAAFENLAKNIAAHAFMGADFRWQLGESFLNLYQDLSAGVDPVLPPNLPLPRFIRRERAKRKIHAMLQQIIAERRLTPDRYDDFLQDFVEAKYQDGRPATDELVTNMIVLMLFAGYETTSCQGSWSLIQLLQHPDYLHFVLEEQATLLLPGQSIDLSTLRQLKYLEWALKETERLHPAADIILRYTAEAYQVGDYYIPAGWYTLISPYVSHRLPELFSDPDCYDPLRFGPGRAEDRRHPFALVGFGGGLHKCTGMGFAYNEMKVIISLLWQRYQLELLTPDPVPVYGMGAIRPESPCLVRYRRKQATEVAGGVKSTDVVVAKCPYEQSGSQV